MLRGLIVLTLLSCFAGGQAAAQEAIGAVSRIQGGASGTRGGATQPLGPNASVFPNEVVSTGDDSRVEVMLKDNTRLTLGGNTKLTLNTYVFDRAAGLGTIKFEVVGAFRFLSGQVSKLAQASVNVTTPVANIGIRGTEFWAGPIDNQALGVFLLNGAVTVSNAAGAQTLSQPGQGHQYRGTGHGARARDPLAIGQGQPRACNRDVPIARDPNAACILIKLQFRSRQRAAEHRRWCGGFSARVVAAAFLATTIFGGAAVTAQSAHPSPPVEDIGSTIETLEFEPRRRHVSGVHIHGSSRGLGDRAPSAHHHPRQITQRVGLLRDRTGDRQSGRRRR